MSDPLVPYDVAAYERFCADLVEAGFSPRYGTHRRRWSGPIHPGLAAMAKATRMEIVFYDGWPYRYAHVVVPGFVQEHSGNGVICLWAEDDPAQLAGMTLSGLWARLDGWAAAAAAGFNEEDQALDSYIAFEGSAKRIAELDLPDLLTSASNGHIGVVYGRKEGGAVLLSRSADEAALVGAFYYRTTIGSAPRTMAEFRSALTRRQRAQMDHGLDRRSEVAQNEPSGGLDHVVLAWPRHGEHDALVLSFSGAGATLKAHPNPPSPSDTASRLRRAGPDATAVADKRVLLAGVGAVGGHVAVTLANSGLGYIIVRDDDKLRTVNLVRHVLSGYLVGYEKTAGVAVRIGHSAPWCDVRTNESLSHDPEKLAIQVRGHDLVIDCTGIYSMTAALSHVCSREGVPLLSGALYHQGALLRIRRQAQQDTPFTLRGSHSGYVALPPDRIEAKARGFLELGCTARIHNASPAAVLRAAADIARAALDTLTGRYELGNDLVTVLRPLDEPPFDRLGPVRSPSGSDGAYGEQQPASGQ